MFLQICIAAHISQFIPFFLSYYLVLSLKMYNFFFCSTQGSFWNEWKDESSKRPTQGTNPVEASPAFPPSDNGRSRPSSAAFKTSFGSLTLLGMGDDASSEMTASSSGAGDGYLSYCFSSLKEM